MSQTGLCALLTVLIIGGSAPALNATGMALPGSAPSRSGAAPSRSGVTSLPDGPDDPADLPRHSAGRFGWPLPGSPVVVRAFDPPVHRFGPGHRGVDLAAEAGTSVLAAGAGTVVFAGLVAGRGVVSIDHPGGLRTTYEPVSPVVAAGDRVAGGQPIGTVRPGHPGCATACLHWGVRRGITYLDPLHLLAVGRVRLLPWADHPGER